MQLTLLVVTVVLVARLSSTSIATKDIQRENTAKTMPTKRYFSFVSNAMNHALCQNYLTIRYKDPQIWPIWYHSNMAQRMTCINFNLTLKTMRKIESHFTLNRSKNHQQEFNTTL
jgi:hypothetical protein